MAGGLAYSHASDHATHADDTFAPLSDEELTLLVVELELLIVQSAERSGGGLSLFVERPTDFPGRSLAATQHAAAFITIRLVADGAEKSVRTVEP